MAGVDLGRVAYVPKGAYDPEMIYNRLDVVSYQGSSYVSRIDGNTGNTPEVGVNWASVASKGDKGDKGDKGATGAQGVKGDTGAIGPQGPKGDTGPVGPQGVIGDTGAKGDKGDKGDTGAIGATGPQGLKGDKGDPGQNGVISVDAPSDGKTYGRKNEAWAEIVASNQYLDFDTLFPSNAGTLSDADYQKIVDAWENRVLLAKMGEVYVPLIVEKGQEAYILHTGQILYSSSGIDAGAAKFVININDKTYTVVFTSQDFLKDGTGTKFLSDNGEYLTPPNATPTTSGYMSADDKKRLDNTLVFKNTYLDLTPAFNANGNFVSTIPQSLYDKIAEAFNNKTTSGLINDNIIVPINISKDIDGYVVSYALALAYGNASNMMQFVTLSIESNLNLNGYKNESVFNVNGDGTEALMDNGAYKRVVVLSPLRASSLTNLPIGTYSIEISLNSASALSFVSTPPEGWECMIDIKNTGSSTITQALPNASGWQCDDTSITIAAGKIASISVRYVHGTYVVIAKGN